MDLHNPDYWRALHLTNLMYFHAKERTHVLKQLATMDLTQDASIGHLVAPALAAVSTGDLDATTRRRAAKPLGKIGPAAFEAMQAVVGALNDNNICIRKN